MGWFDSAVDFVSDNSGSIVSGIGAGMEFLSGKKAEKKTKDAAKRQAEEYERVAEANREISLYDAEVARRMGMKSRAEADAKAGLMYKDMKKLLASQRVRYAKSGVALKSGSPVDIMEQTTIDAGSDIMNVKYQGKSAQSKANSLARRYRLLADKGLRDAAAQAALVEEAASDTAEAMKWNRYGKLADRVYTIGSEHEWF